MILIVVGDAPLPLARKEMTKYTIPSLKSEFSANVPAEPCLFVTLRQVCAQPTLARDGPYQTMTDVVLVRNQ